MQIDQLLHAITSLTSVINSANYYTLDGKHDRTSALADLRCYVLRGDAEGFANYCQSILRTKVDIADDVICRLWEHLGLSENCDWEEFVEKFLK